MAVVVLAVHERAHQVAAAREPDERDQREGDPEREHDLAEHEHARRVEPDRGHDQRRQHRHQPAHEDRDLPVDEPLHHDLARERADGRAREPGGEQRQREERARGAAEERLERLVRGLERGDVEDAGAVEDRRGDDQHRHVDQAGDRHRDHHVDLRVVVEAPRLRVVARDDAVLGQRRVEVDHVRHHRRAEDPDREQHRLAARELRLDRVQRDRAERRVGEVELGQVADADRGHEAGDHGLEDPQAEALQAEDQEGDRRR